MNYASKITRRLGVSHWLLLLLLQETQGLQQLLIVLQDYTPSHSACVGAPRC